MINKCKLFKIIILSVCQILIVSLIGLKTYVLNANSQEYEIYPLPHIINYLEGSFTLSDEINVEYGSEIDQETKVRLNEALGTINLTLSNSDNLNTNNTKIIIKTLKEDTDQDMITSLKLATTDLFSRIDNYYLKIENNTIAIYAKEPDGAFYGVTTLYHILQQVRDKTVRNLVIEDYADIASRGFIEGYYGNPWSLDDRIELMKWAGYYKLNSYFYAPKNDPKHNQNGKNYIQNKK